MKKGMSSPVLLDQAKVHLAHGLFAEAIDCLCDAVRQEPANLRAHIKLSEALEKAWDWENAIRVLNQVITLAPDSAEAALAKGHLTVETGFMRPLDYYRLAVNMAPDFADGHYYLGYKLYQNGQLLEALVQLTRCLCLDRYSADALLLRCQIYCRLNRLHEAHEDLLAYVALRGRVTDEEKVQLAELLSVKDD